MNLFSQFPPRGAQTDAKWQSACARDLKGFVPSRKEVDFRNLNKSLDDKFYEINFTSLYVLVYEAMTSIFGTDNIPHHESPWLRSYPKEFIRYTEMLAHPGTHGSNWDSLLVDGKERCFLMQAIVMKTLDVCIFSSLLFGASDEHRDILDKQDKSLANLEGYERTYLRAHTNMSYLNSTGSMPPLFWRDVDSITSRMMAMLLPVYILVGKAEPKKAPRPSAVFQQLHEIVAIAGWLNVAVRVSPSITVMDWLAPGDRHQVDQANLSPRIHKRSVREAKQLDLLNSAKHGHCPRVKISVTPRIMRYVPAEQGGTDGQGTYAVMQAHAAYYNGYIHTYTDMAHSASLADHILDRTNQKAKRDVLYGGTMFTFMVLVIFVAWALVRLIGYESQAVDMVTAYTKDAYRLMNQQ